MIERRPREVRLSRTSITALAEHFGHVLELTPVPGRGRYRLVTRGYAGSMTLPGLRIDIRPKVPLRSLFDLLDANDPLGGPDDVPPQSGLSEYFGRRLALALSRAAAAGLPFRFVEREGRVPFLRGRLDVAEQLRDPGRPTGSFPCRFEEFTIDHPTNRLARAAADALTNGPGLSLETRSALQVAARPYADVSPVVPEAIIHDRSPADPLTELCRQVLRAMSNHPAAPAFLLNLEQIFERFVSRGIESGFADDHGFVVEAQPTVVIPGRGVSPLRLRPDLVIRRDGRPVVILDAKWKRLRDGPDPADLHQILSYRALLGARELVLAYPDFRDRETSYDLPGGGRMTLRSLGVTSGSGACRHALDRFVAALRRKASDGNDSF